MINKKNIWFLTLFSLILVLSVYYITMPSELLLKNIETTETGKKEKTVVEVEESELLTVLRVEADEEMLKEMDSLKLILTDAKKSVEEKNTAFDKMKSLNITKGEETSIESQVKEEFKLESFVKIKDDQIKIVIDHKEHTTELANQIMRFVQQKYETKKYITVEFK